MRVVLLLVVAVSFSINGVASFKLPETYPLCRQTDQHLNDCIQNATQIVIPQLKDGIPSIKVASLDPLQVTSINIAQGQGPISINLQFSDITVKGFSDAIVDNAKVDLNNYNLRFHGVAKNVSFVANYEMSGRMLLLPITGNGPCKLLFTNIRADLGPMGKEVMKKGKKYFDVTDFYLDIKSVDRVEPHFDNLFNGDKTLGDSMNNLLKEHWKELWAELKPAFTQVFAEVFRQYTKRIFDAVAFNDVFLE